MISLERHGAVDLRRHLAQFLVLRLKTFYDLYNTVLTPASRQLVEFSLITSVISNRNRKRQVLP